MKLGLETQANLLLIAQKLETDFVEQLAPQWRPSQCLQNRFHPWAQWQEHETKIGEHYLEVYDSSQLIGGKCFQHCKL